MFVIRHSELLDEPKTGWDDEPDDTETTEAADLVRIKRIRNSAYAHAISASLAQSEHERLCNELHNIFNRLIPERKFQYLAFEKKFSGTGEQTNIYAQEIQKWYEEDIGIKHSIAKLSENVKHQSKKIDKLLKRLTGNFYALTPEVSEMLAIQRHFKQCYNFLISNYQPFEGLNLTIDLTKSPSFFLKAVDVSGVLVNEVSIQTELEMFFADNQQENDSGPQKPVATSTMKAIASVAARSSDKLKPLVVIEGCRGIGKTTFALQLLHLWTFSSGPLRDHDIVMYLPFMKFDEKVANVLEVINENYCKDGKTIRKKISRFLKYSCKNFKVCFIFDFSLCSKIPLGVLKTIYNCRKYCAVILCCRSFSLQVSKIVPMNYSRRYQLKGLRDGVAFANYLSTIPYLKQAMRKSLTSMLQMIPESLKSVPLVLSLLIQSVITSDNSKETVMTTPTILFQKLINMQMQKTVSRGTFSILESYSILFSCADTCFENLGNPTLKSTDFENCSALTNLLELGFLSEKFSLSLSSDGFEFECFDVSVHYFLAAYSFSNKQFLKGESENSSDFSKLALVKDSDLKRNSENGKITFMRFLTGLAGNGQKILHWVVSLSNVPNKFLFALDLFIEINQMSYQKSSNLIGNVLRALEPVHKSVHVTSTMFPREKAGLLRYLCIKNCSLVTLKTDDSLPISLFAKVIELNSSLRQLIFYDLSNSFVTNLPLLLQAVSKSKIESISLEFISTKSNADKSQIVLSGSFCDQLLTSMKTTNLTSLRVRNFSPTFSTCVGFDLFGACFSFNTLRKLKQLDISGLKVTCNQCSSKTCSQALLVYQILLKPNRWLNRAILQKIRFKFSTCDSFQTFVSTLVKKDVKNLKNLDFQYSSFSINCNCEICQNYQTRKTSTLQSYGSLTCFAAGSSLDLVELKKSKESPNMRVYMDNCMFTFSSTNQLTVFNSALKSAFYSDIVWSLQNTSIQCLTHKML